MNLSTVSKGIAVVAIFLVATIVLYLFYTKAIIPDIIFYIGFGITILVCVYIMMKKPTKNEWRDIRVIPVKRRR